MVVAAGPGGGHTKYTQFLAPFLEKHMPGNPKFIVQNMGGAGGTKAANFLYTRGLKDGKIVDATASDTKRLNEIFDTDPGARYVGEFSLGFNPHIKEPMCDILFDEKIAGSLHFTPGQAYEECDNGNRSAVHWDMVLIQRPEYGGGEVWFDDELIRKDGMFVPKDLKPLNPSNLK